MAVMEPGGPMPEVTFTLPIMPIVNGLIGGLVSFFLMRLLHHRQKHAVKPGWVGYGATLKVVFGLAFPMIMVMNLAAAHAVGDQHWMALKVMMPLTFGLLAMLVELFGRQVRYDAETITLMTPWGRTRQVRWAEIVGYRWRKWWVAHELLLKDGRSFLLSDSLHGLRAFFERVRAQFELLYPEMFAAEKWTEANEKIIAGSLRCGCVHCLAIFDAGEIADWIGDALPRTALCPRCGMNSVIGDASEYPVTPAALEKARAAIMPVPRR